MPTKSTGCAVCRKRKIRCDETRPGCKKCTTHGVQCPGYRQPLPGMVEFEDQTDMVVKKARAVYSRKLTPSSSSRDGSSPSSSSSGSSGAEDSRDVRALMNGTLTAAGTGMQLLWERQTSPRIAAGVDLKGVNSAAVERLQLYGTFLSIYLPPAHADMTDPHFGMLKQLYSHPDSAESLHHSLDALSLVQIGSVHHDTNLLVQSSRSYSRSLASLAVELSQPGRSNDDLVLGAITLLAQCEFFDHIAGTGPSGWLKHMDGAQQLLSVRGPDSIQTELAFLLYSNTRHAALSHSLIKRKSCLMGTPAWRAVAFRSPVIDMGTPFYDVALQIPALLEKTDAVILGSERAPEKLDRLLEDARKFQRALEQWQTDLEHRARYTGVRLYHPCPIETFPTFTMMVRDRTIDHCYTFMNFSAGYIMTVYWNCMHYLRTTIQQLHKLRSAVHQGWTPASTEVVSEEEIMEITINLCWCLPFLSSPAASSIGHIGMFLPIRTTMSYFVEHGHWAHVEWANEVRTKVLNKGMGPPGWQEFGPQIDSGPVSNMSVKKAQTLRRTSYPAQTQP